MLKTMLTMLCVGLFVFAGFASTPVKGNVTEASRYRANLDNASFVVNETSFSAKQISPTVKSQIIVLGANGILSHSNSQLGMLGANGILSHSNSQLGMLCANGILSHSNSQLGMLGANGILSH